MITVRSDVGGGPRHVFDLARGLRNLGEKVYLTIASPTDPPNFNRFLSVFDYHLSIPHRKFSLLTFLKLLLFCKLNSVTVVHSHGRGAGYYSRLLSLFGINIVHTFHGAHLEKTFFGKLKGLLDKWFSIFPQKLICVSHDESHLVQEYGWGKQENITVIHNGVDQSFIQRQFNSLTKEEARLKFNLPLDKKILGTLSRLTFQKGIDRLIESSDILKLNQDNYHFVVAGNGEDFELLKSKISKLQIPNVIILGEINEPAIFLKALDGYFSFARWEGFPLSVLEALAVGLPCFISDVSGHGDLRDQCKLFDPNKSDDFYKAIKSEKTGHEKFQYTIENMTLKTRKIYLL